MALLEARSLTRRPWFEGRDLQVDAGEIVVLAGPTGSGKTLFLRTVADLDAADAGDVFLDDASRSEMDSAAWRRGVLYVHQSGVRLPGSVQENLERIAEIASVSIEGLDLGLDAAADADRLSGGERQALALERAFLCNPRVLLLDESTSAMDAATATRWEERVSAWVRSGGGVLWVAHDTLLAGRIGARVESFP